MKSIRDWAPLVALFFLGTVVAAASGSIPTGTGGGMAGPGPGCPTGTMKGTIKEVHPDRQMFVLLTKDEQEIEVPIQPDTRFRVKGVKKKDLKTDPLAKVTVDAPVKITYCTTDARLLEVKVNKPKKKS